MWGDGLLDLVLEKRKPNFLDLFSTWSVLGVSFRHSQDELVLNVRILLKRALVADLALGCKVLEELGLLHASLDLVGHLVEDQAKLVDVRLL